MPQEVIKISFGILFLIAGWEWSNLIESKNVGIKYIFLIILAGLMLFINSLIVDTEIIKILSYFSILCWSILFFSMFFYPLDIPSSLGWLIAIIVLSQGFIAINWIYKESAIFLLVFLSLVWVMDVGAYFVGKYFGRIKLAKFISPNKTWEGLIGGLLAVTLLSIPLSKYLLINSFVFISFSIAIGLLSVVGDLTFSMLKRNANIKDSGNILPGHGGILDRIDSILSSAPLFTLGLIFL
jgi:phosphatidate cytidylyltransferase